MRSVGSFKRALGLFAIVALLSLGGMALTLAIGLARADRLIERVSRSQTQLALVTRLEADLTALRLAPSPAGSIRLATAIRDYRRTIDEEARIVPRGQRPFQAVEAARGDRLAALAGRGDAEDLLAFRALVRDIVAAERGEAAASIAAMRDLRRTGTVAAIVLPVVLALLGLGVAIAMMANLFRPIAALQRGVSGLAAGGAVPVDPVGFTDFDDLAHAFNHMARQIAEQRMALAQANDDLERQIAERTASLAERNARLAAIDANRRLFFAQVGHELRTPITVIMGEAEVALRDSAASVERLREAFGHVVANGQFAQRRLEDLLSLADAEDGRLMLAREPVDLAAVMRAAAAQAMPYARSSGIAVAMSLPVDAPADALIVRGDASWLQQALLALIDNAVKHADGERIELGLACAGDRATLTVADDGPGVAPADLPHVFETYYQASSRRGGSGLGLAVARWVTQAHDGRISARNLDGGGFCVSIDLPLAA